MKQTIKKTPGPAPARAVPPSRARYGVLALILVLACGGTWAVLEWVVWSRLPAALVGKWVVVDGPQEGAMFDFFRNGTLVGRVNVGGKEGVIDATVRVEGDKLYSTTRHPETGRPDTRV